jgi:hypothetical protein
MEHEHESPENWEVVPSLWKLAQQAYLDDDFETLQKLLCDTAVIEDVRKLCRTSPVSSDGLSLIAHNGLQFHMLLLTASHFAPNRDGRMKVGETMSGKWWTWWSSLVFSQE